MKQICPAYNKEDSVFHIMEIPSYEDRSKYCNKPLSKWSFEDEDQAIEYVRENKHKMPPEVQDAFERFLNEKSRKVEYCLD